MSYRHTSAIIHLDHLKHNLQTLRALVGPKVFFCPMVKANAYGHGDIEVARCLEKNGVTTLGVGLVEEGLLLRENGIKTELLVFGVFGTDAVEEVLQKKLTPVLSTWDQLHSLEKITQPLNVHLKFDTGMHRLGFSMSDADKLASYFQTHKKLQLKGLLTHLYKAEDADQFEGASFEQLKKFKTIEQKFSTFSPLTHTLNSAGLLHFSQHKNKKLPHDISTEQGVRPGLLIYGVSPLTQGPQIKPVMSLRSHIVRYHHLAAGESVSYGGTWKASTASIVGVVPMGYADGYHRRLSNHGELLFRGRKVPVIGNVCMDYLMVDLTKALAQQNSENLGEEEVTLFGYDSQGHLLDASEVAVKAQTIPWEILTSVGERVPREYVGAAS